MFVHVLSFGGQLAERNDRRQVSLLLWLCWERFQGGSDNSPLSPTLRNDVSGGLSKVSLIPGIVHSMTHYNTRRATGDFPRVMWGRCMRLDMSVTDWTGMSQKVDYCCLPLAYPTNITLGNVARQTPYCTVCWMRSCPYVLSSRAVRNPCMRNLRFWGRMHGTLERFQSQHAGWLHNHSFISCMTST